MSTYLKYRPAWSQLLVFIGLSLAIFMVLSVIGMFILSRATGIGLMEMTDVAKWDLTDPKTLFMIRGMLVVQFLCLFVIPVFLFAYFSDPKPLQYLGLSQPTTLFYVGLGVLIMFASIPLAGLLGVLNQSIPFPSGMQKWMDEMGKDTDQQISYMLGQKGVWELIKNIFFIAVFAGVGEELFFRGVLQRLLIRWFKSPWAGILATAALFSAIHFQFDGFLPRFMLGILLGGIYWYSGSLWPAIIAHFVYDAFIVVAAYVDPTMIEKDNPVDMSGWTLALAGSISLAAVIAIFWWMKKKSTNSFEKVYAADNAPTDPFTLS